MWDLWLIFGIGFLGSFGHCVGMCGPITVALALSKQTDAQQDRRRIDRPNTDRPNKNQRRPHRSQKDTTEWQSPTCDCDTPPDPISPEMRLESQETMYSPAHQPNVTQSDKKTTSPSPWFQLRFHLLLNLGRLLSYALVGASIGAIGSVLVAGGQVAGVGSELRRGITILTGILLIWFGVVQINPVWLPQIPLLNPMHSRGLHERLQHAMSRLSLNSSVWTPFLLGMIWGLIPCGFLYAAQIKAAETTDFWWGGATLLAFGLGTLPSMVGIGLVSTWLGSDRRHQLFRLGGWVTLTIGILTVLRTGDQMVDYSGHAALLCLLLALLARPISRLWAAPLQYRRALGVGAFVLSLVHVLHTLEHAWSWNVQAFFFMLPQHQWGIGFGIGALALMTPLMLTSFDWAQKRMGANWRRLHLLSIPALGLVVIHCLLIGTHYLGRVQFNWVNALMITTLAIAVLVVFLARSRPVWRLFSMEKWYVPPRK